jgi:DNA-binding transcriptional LysR family regulator
MDIWQLRYFISVAKNLNFTEAAKELYVGQSTLSKQVAELEKELGVQLFIRNNRSVRLTTAGTILLNEAQVVLNKVEEAVQKVRQAASGFVGTLKIGIMGTSEKMFLPGLVKKFRCLYPNIDVLIERLSWRLINDALNSGEIDIGFTLALGLEGVPGLVWEPVYKCPLCVVLPFDHPLAGEKTIKFAALANEPFVITSPTQNPAVYADFQQVCARHGFTPKIVSQPDLLETVLFLVESGVGITLLSHHIEGFTTPKLRLVDIDEDAADIGIVSVAAWKQENPKLAISLFIEELKTVKQTSTTLYKKYPATSL